MRLCPPKGVPRLRWLPDPDFAGPPDPSLQERWENFRKWNPTINFASREEHAESIRKWNEATDYATLIRLNRQFLRGEMTSSPSDMCGIASETAPILPSLLRLHVFGILTTGSQPAGREGPVQMAYVDEGLEDAKPQVGRCELWKWQWISFVLLTQNVPILASSLDLFVKMLSNHPSFITRVYDYERPWMAYNNRKMGSMEMFGKRYQVMLDAPVVLCRERFELTLEELEKADFESRRINEVIPDWLDGLGA